MTNETTKSGRDSIAIAIAIGERNELGPESDTEGELNGVQSMNKATVQSHEGVHTRGLRSERRRE